MKWSNKEFNIKKKPSFFNCQLCEMFFKNLLSFLKINGMPLGQLSKLEFQDQMSKYLWLSKYRLILTLLNYFNEHLNCTVGYHVTYNVGCLQLLNFKLTL